MIVSFDGHTPDIADDAFIAPNATIIGRVSVAEGCSIWFQSVLRGDVETITVQKGANIQDFAMVHADPGSKVEIGAFATIGHHATVHGCTIGAGALVGINAVVLNGAVVGEGSLIGANALVPEGMQIPPKSLVVG